MRRDQALTALQALMTTLALGEQIGRYLTGCEYRVQTVEAHAKVTHEVTIGKQIFIVTCEESAPDKQESAV